jgi:murein DD-endopeptidase MepM/ murein hydrolase activator NlpD
MPRPGYTILVHRDGALDSRQLRVRGWVARLALLAGSAFLVALTAALVLFGPIVVAAGRAPLLAREVTRLRQENTRVGELARRLDEVEARYAELRGMLGADVPLPDARARNLGAAAAGEERLYVAPAILARAPSPGLAEGGGPSVPHRWPLSVPSFRTRGLAAGDPSVETHAGLDLAVPAGSDVRASGGGTVEQTGTDAAYGLFVLLVHPEGYETMYGHLSRILVRRGEVVRSGQVIALSGSSGRSTAPHLHFEIRRAGRSIDPLSLVREGT